MWIMWSMGMWHVDCGLRYVDYGMWSIAYVDYAVKC